MIVKVPKPGLTDYERKYFLEANVEDRPNMKHITIDDEGTKINGKLVESSEEDMVEAEDLEGDDDMDDTDIEGDEEDLGDEETEDDESFDDDDIPDEDGEDGGDTDDGIATEDTEDSEDGDGGGDTGGGEDVPTEDSEGEESAEEDTGGEDDVPSEDAEGDDSSEDGGNSEENSDDSDSGDMDEKIRKRALFQRFRVLHDAVDKYVEKLNMMMAYSSNMVKPYQEICSKFTQIKDCLYDYMLVKFSSAKLPASALFYHRALVATALVLDELADITKKAKADDSTET